ncbi:MAG TPA: matrixin family metalloprotease [Candidatus Nanopelagicales bacterium]|nr:matrixin family metalloprotease [Candidatus Nanopelagicales bacterium]
MTLRAALRVTLPSALLASAALLTAGRADAFCRATTCRVQDACDGQTLDGCAPLIWKRGCIGITIQEDASLEIDYERARLTMDAAFAAWQSVDCGGAAPSITIQNMGPVTCDRVEFNTTAGNANILVFRDGTWPHVDGQHNLALTTVSFDPKSGELYNADIEVNTAGYDFIDGEEYDFLSVLTHEAGHFLGLAHTTAEGATMLPTYEPFSTEFQSLAEDDVFGICSVYPPSDDVDPGRCNPIPRHGFSPVCGSEQIAGCAIASVGVSGVGGAGAGVWGGGALVGAAVAMGLRRRRRREVRGRSERRRG